MPLSEYEQSVIDDLERSLQRDDPKLAKAFRSPTQPAYPRIIGIAVAMLLGIGVLILGSVLHQPLIVAGGFAVVFGVLAWWSSSRKAPAPIDTENDYNYPLHTPKELTTSNSSENNSRFMDRLEGRWNRRQSELG